MAEIYELDVSAANNNSAPPDGFPENMQYSQVNNAAREQMAVLARYIQALGAITTTGAGNAYILTITQAPVALTNGMHFIFKADKTNTGAATLQLNALGAVALRDVNGTALAAGAVVADGVYFVIYDGAVFRIVGSESAANVKTKYESNADTNAFDDAAQTKLAGVETGATADQTAGEIKTLYESNGDTNAFDDAAQTKLAGIETGATADQTAAEIRTAVESAADSNVFTDADHSKLNGIEASATADQTAAEIRAAVAAATDSNVFTDADHAKLDGIAPGATANVQATEATAGVAEVATTAEVSAGIDDTRMVTPAKLAGVTEARAILTADETRTSTTAPTSVAALSGLELAEAGEWYAFRLVARVAGSTTGGLRIRFTAAATVQDFFARGYVTDGIGAGVGGVLGSDSVSALNADLELDTTGVGATDLLVIEGFVHNNAAVSANGLGVNMAQRVSNATVSTMFAGAHLTIRKMS